MKKTKKVVYVAVCGLMAIIGVLLGIPLLKPLESYGSYAYYGAIAGITALMILLGALLAPPVFRLTEKLADKVSSSFSGMSTPEIAIRITGLIIGLIIGTLLGTNISNIEVIGSWVSVLIALLLGYIGYVVGAKVGTKNLPRLREFRENRFHFFRSNNAAEEEEEEEEKKDTTADEKEQFLPASPKLIDTSVIIDGRIADIYRTGFIEGKLIIPSFVLAELQHIADSSDSLKRNRGRCGLDTLNLMQEQYGDRIIISEQDYPDINEVDTKLVRMAIEQHAHIITNDFNLNKVARLQGVTVLNINELSNALKPVMLPGEEMTLQVIKAGKEAGQGIAYLDDGTMIVIEKGSKYVGSTIPVVVTSILQTSAGRMVFARPKAEK